MSNHCHIMVEVENRFVLEYIPVMKLTEGVKHEIDRPFEAHLAVVVKSELENAMLPRCDTNEERVHFAIAYLARGDLLRFRLLLEQAKSDWRDTLVGAGLAHANWREILKQREQLKLSD